jgi:hypothetical protein
MAQVLEHIDKIARDKNRDVLFIVFKDAKNEIDEEFSYDYETDSVRAEFLLWLNQNNIPYQKCGPIASVNGWESYRGQLYIDVPMDENDQRYQKLNNHLENQDGTMKIAGISYYYIPLKVAMKNAHHDEPGFWEKWAENF